MRECRDCRRRGLLLRLDGRGFCEACARRLDQRLERRVGRIRGALAAAEAPGEVDWIVEELGRAEGQCRDLARLERSALGRASPRTEVLLRTVADRRDRVLSRWADTVAGAAARQVQRLASPEEKEALLQETLERLRGHQDKVTAADGFLDCQRKLSDLLVRVRAESGVEVLETSVHRAPARLLREEMPPANAAPPVAAEPKSPTRRRAPRRRQQFHVTLSPGGESCLSEDVSSTGILLHSPQEQRVGDFLDLYLHTARGRFHTTGIVVWTGHAERAGSLSNTLAVAFTGGVPVAAA